MKYLSTTLFLLCFSIYISGQESAYPKVPITELYHIVAEGDNITTIGSCDKALYSNDGGTSWKYFNIDLDVEEIAIVPGSEGKQIYIVDEDELYILDTNDESIISTGITSSSLISGDFEGIKLKNQTLLIVGSISVFQSPIDNLNFTKVGDLDYGGSDRIDEIELTENYAWVSTREGLIFKGDLNTNTLELVHDFENNLRNFTMGTDEIGYVSFSSSQDPLKTTDGGSSWNPITSFSEVSNLYAYGEDVIISRNTNRLVISTDGGATSTYVPYDANSDHSYLADLEFTADGTMYLAGESSTILKSTDFGITHENLNPYPRAGFTDIDLNENGKGVAIAGQSLILMTEDDGETWSQLEYEPIGTNNYLTSCIITKNGDILVIHGQGIEKIENGQTSLISEEVLSSVMYDSEEDYFIGVKRQGNNFIVRKSIDGGITWESKSVLSDYSYNQSSNHNGIYFIGVSDEEYVISRDHGETWETKPNTLGSNISSSALFGENTALLTAGNSMFKTEDGFETFTIVSTGYGQFNIQMYSEDHYLFTSAQNAITTVRESKDGGETWSAIDSYCAQTFCSDLQGDKYWMGQRGGHINYTKLDLSTSASEVSISTPLTIQNNVLQNGENMTMTFDRFINGSGAIFSQSGQLVNQFHINNANQKTISANNFKSGVYFIKIIEGNNTHQGKFIII